MTSSHFPRIPRGQDGRRARRGILLTIALTVGVMGIEVVGGIRANSLALLSDAGHMLTDVFALLLALFAVTMSRHPATTHKTYGYYRIEILTALTNGVVLVAICLAIFYGAYGRFIDPEPVESTLVLIVASIGLVANLIGMRVLSRASRSLNVRTAHMHVVADAMSSAGVILAGVVIGLTSWYRIDPLLSVGIGIIILRGAYRLLRETVDILLEGTPHGIDPESVCRAIERIEGIQGVHDLHIWSITSGMHALSGHVILDSVTFSQSDAVLNSIKEMLREQFGIDHTTIQIESESYTEVGEIH
ncbi:MAG: cation diffusion facilitator family transporter [Acidobacteriota bacterium]